ncbi:MAG: zinc finger-like domain-containing protein [Thermoguttaceae bacterium]|nr:zinc finger-like domain-containing protein [Thermoguttaceae bacterium]
MTIKFVQSVESVQEISIKGNQKTSAFSRLLTLIIFTSFLFLFCGAIQASNYYLADAESDSDVPVYVWDEPDDETTGAIAPDYEETETPQEENRFNLVFLISQIAKKGFSKNAHQFGIIHLPDANFDPILQIFLSLGLLFVLGIVVPILYRMIYGATPSYLLQSRFYEISSLRLLFYVVKIFFILCFLEGIILTGVLAHQMYCNGWNETLLVQTAATLVIALILGAVAGFFSSFLVTLPQPIPPCNDTIRNITRSNTVSRKYLRRLGDESFPEMLLYGKSLGLWVRRLLFTVQITPFIMLAVAFAINIFEANKKWDWANDVCTTILKIYEISVQYMMEFMSELPVISPEIAIPVFVCGSFLFIFLMKEDNSCLIIRFPMWLILVSMLAAVLFYCFCMVYQELEPRLTLLGILDVIFIIRFQSDLSRASHFLQERRVIKPLAMNLEQIFPQAAEMKQREDCELPAMNMDEVALRIENGLHNVEKYSFMALRNMARFIGIIHVEQERFAAVRVRFMTVRRFTAERLIGGTYGFYYWPIVPIWDETLFPLDPPNGYVNYEEYNWLGSEWNGVRICSDCNGTGKIEKTETYTEKDYISGKEETKTRTVYETCTTCNGTGRLEYQQAIVTQWQKQIIISVEPTTPLPDYMADVEDRTYYSMRLIENRIRLDECAQIDEEILPDLVNSLERSSETLKRTQLENYVHTVEKFHDGSVYRSDVQAIGFWTLRVIFKRLLGKYGWFFGRNSDFYFHTIPLSVQSLFAVSIMLPIYIAIAVFAFAVLSAFSISYLFP